MPAWWTSIEAISRLDSILRLLVATSAVVTAIFGLLIWLSSHQLTKLRNEKENIAQIRLSAAETETVNLRKGLELTAEELKRSGKTVDQLNAEAIKAQKKIEDLALKAKQAERGDITRYEFNGMLRKQHGGTVNLIEDTKEAKIFLQIDQLEKERKYPELLALCKKQISATPDWLTPYLFLGVAQANTGLKTEAISSFEHVIKNAPDDPAYQQAKEFIKKLKQ